MKKARASRSASETQLRSKATSYIGQGSKKKSVINAVTAARIASAIGGDKDKKSSKPVYVEAEVVSRGTSTKSSNKSDSSSRGPVNVRSERVDRDKPRAPRQVTGGKRPAALPAPKPSPKPKSPKGARKEKTPGMQTVFKATPAVDLNEGPNFGKTTSIIEKTTQPKPVKKKKNA